MSRCLERFMVKKIFDNNMVLDLLTIIQKIPEEKFVQATLNIQPFRPSFTGRKERSSKGYVNNVEEDESSPVLGANMRKTITKFKHSVH